ncbi:NAD-dependent deacetylase [Streptomonospora algeriensis]|uniref:protein acetyllysine N-acetyltransferase n=1 Tax=Streptomonospora algeriensis TaxID=995084 RepID=A0ABW3BAQ7_9ACTN
MTATSRPADVASLLSGADSITVLTGAGVSTDSGIPDFRGPQGVWTKDPGAAALFDFDTYMADVNVRRRVWQMRRENPAWQARPNAAHQALADLDAAGRLRALITQNIDGLHQAAGAAEDRVLEVHGTIKRVACMECGARTPTPRVLERLEEESDPRCLACGGIQKTDTVSFGQRLDPRVLDAAVEAAAEGEVFLTAGTSLGVHPVAGLCDVALDNGASLVIVNAEPTPYDGRAEAVLRDPISEVVPKLAEYALGAQA